MTIDLSDQRVRKAFEIERDAGQWLKCRSADGAKVYGVPSQHEHGRYYLVTLTSCDCPDARRHPSDPCKHRIACHLHCLKQRVPATRRMPTMVSPEIRLIAAEQARIFGAD
jgi:hypothetical protein